MLVFGVFFRLQVCELDIIYNYEKAYFILNEFICGGEIQETSKNIILRSVSEGDATQEVYLLKPIDIECQN